MHCAAERVPIKPGMEYIRLTLKIASPNYPQFDFENCPLLIGFVSSGWAKVTRANQDIIKLEPGQCFLYETNQLQIERTSQKDVCIELLRCNQQFIQSLIDFGIMPEGKSLERLIPGDATCDRFTSSKMQPEALQYSNQLTFSGEQNLQKRLSIEANSLAWIAEVLKQQVQTSSAHKTVISATDRDSIQKITEMIENNPSYEYSLFELCSFGGINEHKLKTCFKAIHGKTVFSYLRMLRMQQAAELLKEDRSSVIDIANEVGYSNASHFARAFKEQYGLLPKAYQCLYRSKV